jgi:hypothetical protein
MTCALTLNMKNASIVGFAGLLMFAACVDNNQPTNDDPVIDDTSLDSSDVKADASIPSFRGTGPAIHDVKVANVVVDRRSTGSRVQANLTKAMNFGGEQNVSFTGATYANLPAKLAAVENRVAIVKNLQAVYALSHGTAGMIANDPTFFAVGSPAKLDLQFDSFACKAIKRSAALRAVVASEGYQSTKTASNAAELLAANKAAITSWARASNSPLVFACSWSNNDDSTALSLVSIDAATATADVVTVFAGA